MVHVVFVAMIRTRKRTKVCGSFREVFIVAAVVGDGGGGGGSGEGVTVHRVAMTSSQHNHQHCGSWW